MPNYDYECSKCGKSFEAFQSMKDEAYKICPEGKCRMETWGRGEVRRLIGAGAGLIFKGSGFYITDYRSEGYKSAAKSDASGSAPSSAPGPGGASAPGSSSPASSSPKSEGSSDSSKSKSTSKSTDNKGTDKKTSTTKD